MRGVFIEGVTHLEHGERRLGSNAGESQRQLSSLGIAGPVHGAVSTVRQCCEGAAGKGGLHRRWRG